MLSFLPDCIYESIKNNQEYHDYVKNKSNDIFCFDDVKYIDVLLKYSLGDMNELKIKTYDIVDKKFHKLLDIIFGDNYICSDDEFNNMTNEEKLYYIYYQNDGSITLNNTMKAQIQKFIEIYKNTNNLSLYTHIIYYMYYVLDCIINIKSNLKFNTEEFNNFLQLENSIYSIIIKKLIKNDSLIQILYHKRIQLYTIFYENVGQFINDDKIIDIISMYIENEKFKYNKFNWNKLIFYQIVFQKMIDKMKFSKAIDCFLKIYSMIIFTLKNKEYTIKSLTHFNQDYIREYLLFLKFFYNFIIISIPNKKEEFLFYFNNLSIIDKNYLYNKLHIDILNKIKSYMSFNSVYSLNWVVANKEKILIINKNLIDK